MKNFNWKWYSRITVGILIFLCICLIPINICEAYVLDTFVGILIIIDILAIVIPCVVGAYLDVKKEDKYNNRKDDDDEE